MKHIESNDDSQTITIARNGCQPSSKGPPEYLTGAQFGLSHCSIHPGDDVWILPGVKHWHGAAPTTAMTHVAIQEKLDGSAAEWMGKVNDQQYRTE